MFEPLISKSLDLLADDEREEAYCLLQRCIAEAKSNIHNKKEELESYFAWGMCLNIMEEYEQAILKFEKVLQYNREYEDALWQISSILFYNLGKAETAKIILEERLIKQHPDNPLYKNTLLDVKSYLSHGSASK
jgi:tetratricopeptide (TPR) repeat protein